MTSIQPARRLLVVAETVTVGKFYGNSFPTTGVDFELFRLDGLRQAQKQTGHKNQHKQTDCIDFFHTFHPPFFWRAVCWSRTFHALFALQFAVVKVQAATATVYRACNPPSISADIIRYAWQGLATSPGGIIALHRFGAGLRACAPFCPARLACLRLLALHHGL